ncbi:hypothetical protein [Lederbergia citri]|uniref:Uncharacterized protein n=1 Tax=Lederbergia citri TaxID=2833580 RepID=A0A942TFM0_9BACI|nr:hypothetical protein [Lederbergia citri]MBS4195322.1 hypothetical protein [Lederbergia citri]
MIYFEVNRNNDVTYIHNMPFDEKYGLGKTEQELRKTGILVESIPEAEQVTGKVPVLKYDGENLYYDYIDAPISEDERFNQLQNELGNILFESAKDKARINDLEMQQGNLLMEIALLKMGGNA